MALADASRQWTTALHHLTIVKPERARALLIARADVHAKAAPSHSRRTRATFTHITNAPTPFSLAKELRTAGEAQPGSAADLVLSAAAVHFLARIQHGGIPTDVWLACVMRHATALV